MVDRDFVISYAMAAPYRVRNKLLAIKRRVDFDAAKDICIGGAIVSTAVAILLVLPVPEPENQSCASVAQAVPQVLPIVPDPSALSPLPTIGLTSPVAEPAQEGALVAGDEVDEDAPRRRRRRGRR
jgi:hypothetical protein